VNTGNNLLFLVVSGLLAFMSVTGLIGMINLQRLSVRIQPPEEVHAGVPSLFSFQLINQKQKIPSFLLELSCQERTAVCGYLPSGATVNLSIPLVHSSRGPERITRLLVRSPFPVSFFLRWWNLPVECSYLVFPRPIACAVTLPGGEGERREQGSVPRRGFEGEIERIVDYTGREPLKLIHWKLSAKGEGFKVKEYGEPSAEPVVIDLQELSGDLEERISCAAWLVRHFGIFRPVGLKAGDDLIQPVQGVAHVRKLLAKLAVYGL
jgi:uncharacterized protein (DUF58 family)